MFKSKIAVVDCDNFFVSCERSQDESFLGKPVCVMGNNDSCVVARSNEAKKLGLPMGYPYFKAKDEFPSVIYLSGNHSLYKKISRQVFDILRTYTPDVEQYSIDEGFFDVSKIRKMLKLNDEQIAQKIRDDIYNQLKIPVSIGIASTKTLAKMATEVAKKSNGICVLEDEEIEQFLKATKLEAVWGVGRHTLPKLKQFGINTAYDLVKTEDFWINKILTKRGLDLKYELLGQIRNPVNPVVQLPKSLQSTRTFAEFTDDKQKIKDSLMGHLSYLCAKLRKHNINAQGLWVMLKDKKFTVTTQKFLFEHKFNSEFEVQKKMFELFDDIFQKNVIYRSCGICVYNIKQDEGQQIDLLEGQKFEKYNNLSKTLDNVEKKFGKGYLKLGRI